MRYLNDIEAFWSSDTACFSGVIDDEFASDKKRLWLSVLERSLPERARGSVLDVGCGPGFFSVLLSELGWDVTAIDCSEEMLRAARANAEKYGCAENVRFVRKDAHKLEGLGPFDAVVSRNLTWTLEEPERAYAEWLRVLKPGGVLLNFDANWDTHLHDPAEDAAFRQKCRELASSAPAETDCSPALAKRYGKIRRALPLSKRRRPLWDFETLCDLGASRITIEPRVAGKLFDDYYSALYADIPTFMVLAIK